MTKEEISEIIDQMPQDMDVNDFIHELVNRALAVEREACAKVCDEVANKYARVHYPQLEGVADECRGEIRVRGEKKWNSLSKK